MYRKFVLSTYCFLLCLLAGCQSSNDQNGPAVNGEASPQQAQQSTENTTAPVVQEQSSDCQLTMGFDPWEPYHFEAVDGVVRGIDVEIVAMLATHQNCNLTFVKDQWTNLLVMLREGRIDVLAGATAVPERESYAWFSRPYRSEQFELFVSFNAELEHDSFQELLASDMRVGLTEGYIYGEEINTAQQVTDYQEQFIYAPIAEVNFTNLADNRIDGFLEDPFVAAAIMRTRGWHDQVTPTGIMVGSTPVSLMFSRQTIDEETMQAFDRSLEQIDSSGEEQAIFKRYLGIER